MTDFKEGGVPTPDYDTDDINFISQKTEFTDDVFVYGKLYADLGGNVQTFSTAGVERIRITKDGRVGIGTDNPQCILDINKDISGGVNNVDTDQKKICVGASEYNDRWADFSNYGAGVTTVAPGARILSP